MFFLRAIAAIQQARNHTEDVEFSPEDAGRSEFGFLCRIIEAAIDAGATTINIPDTVGYTLSEQFGQLIHDLRERIPNSDRAVFSVHCHNDLGLAVANSLAGIEAGARQIECTINGLGERAGNAALEEVVMAMRTRGDKMPFITNIKTESINKISKLVSTVTGFPVQYNKAIVGKNAFAHESGIHQDGMLKHSKTYEIMTPESVGVSQTSLVMGKHSGRHAFKEKLKELGYDIGDNAIQEAFAKFKNLADKKKQVFDDDIVVLIDDQIIKGNDVIKLSKLKIVAGTEGPQKASITLAIEGEEKKVESGGNGPVDAIFNAITQLVPHESKLLLYQVHAVTEGTDAQAEVSVRMQEKGKIVVGKGADTDTLVASAKAYINALNKLLVKREKTAPKSMTVSA